MSPFFFRDIIHSLREIPLEIIGLALFIIIIIVYVLIISL